MNSFTEEDIIKLRTLLKNRMDTNPNITIKISQKRHQVINAKSIITGVYERFITISSIVNGYNESFTINLKDIIMGQFIINEIFK